MWAARLIVSLLAVQQLIAIDSRVHHRDAERIHVVRATCEKNIVQMFGQNARKDRVLIVLRNSLPYDRHSLGLFWRRHEKRIRNTILDGSFMSVKFLSLSLAKLRLELERSVLRSRLKRHGIFIYAWLRCRLLFTMHFIDNAVAVASRSWRLLFHDLFVSGQKFMAQTLSNFTNSCRTSSSCMKVHPLESGSGKRRGKWDLKHPRRENTFAIFQHATFDNCNVLDWESSEY